MLRKGLCLLCLILGILAISSGGYPLYFIFSMLLTLLIFSYVLLHYFVKNIYVVHSVNNKVIQSGESLNVDYRVYNSSYLPMLNVGIEFDIDKKIMRSTSLKERALIGIQDYLPFEKKFICPYRGYYSIGKVIVTLYDPLMLFKRIVTFQKPIEVVVRPKIKKLVLPLLEPKDAYGTLKSDKRALSDETNIANIRPYVRGDMLKNIHWKLSARNDELLTKVYDETVLSRLVIVLDAYKGNFQQGMTLKVEEEMVSFCLSLVYHLIHEGMRLKLIYHAKEKTTMDIDSVSDLDKVLNALTHFESLGNAPITEVLQNITTTDEILVITPVGTNELAYHMKKNPEMHTFTFNGTYTLADTFSYKWIDEIMDVDYEA